jgi:uncharacterized membrane protein
MICLGYIKKRITNKKAMSISDSVVEIVQRFVAEIAPSLVTQTVQPLICAAMDSAEDATVTALARLAGQDADVQDIGDAVASMRARWLARLARTELGEVSRVEELLSKDACRNRVMINEQ